MQMTAPSFADLTSKLVAYTQRNSKLSSEKVWTSMLTIYGEYIMELGWDLKSFKEEVFPAVYELARSNNS